MNILGATIILQNALEDYVNNSLESEEFKEEREAVDEAWNFIQDRLIEMSTAGDTIDSEDVLNWHGSDHSIDELAETLSEILNGDYSIKNARKDILDYREQFDEDE